MTILPIIEWIAYAIIGLAGSLVIGGAVFLSAVSAYERMENWNVERKARKSIARRR